SARIRYGFVPYSTTVNVGHLLNDLNPDYITDKYTYSSRKAVYTTETNTTETAAGTTYGGPDYINYQTVGSWQDYQSGYYPQSSCENNKIPVTSTYADYGSPSTSTSTSTNGSGQKVITTTTTQRQVQITGVRCTGYTAYYYGWPYTAYKMQVTYKSRDKVTYKNDLFDITTTETKKFDHFDYEPVEYDTSTYKTFTSVSTPTGDTSRGASTVNTVSSTWNGCIHERKTVAQSSFSYSPVYGISPASALDLDIDSAPDVYDEDTKWAPIWPQIVYSRYTTSSGYRGTSYTATTGTGDYGTRPSSPCPAAAQGLKEMTQSQFNTYANSLSATGNTYLDIGMIWGGRLLSPDGIFSSTVNSPPANGGEVSRHIVFMTDGVMEPNNSVNQAWGLEWWDRKVTSDGSSGDTARHTSRFLASCEAIKDKGIRIWVIAFTSGLSDDLKACASDDSSFTAADSSQLNAAFQEIAKQVGELRITQ
ncbi:MAG: pilus assembly protein TadG, partial [Novosphingobium sp.]